MADTMEKPVRRRPSFRRVKSGAGTSADSASANGQALPKDSGSKPVALLDRAHARGESGGTRTYHISAAAAASQSGVHTQRLNFPPSTSRSRRNVLASESSDVDLDLSIDFVSHLESHRTTDRLVTAPASPIDDGENDKENTVPSATQTPRGMSSADWHARQRKKPPTPLSLGRPLQGSIDLTSHFSPDSPTRRRTAEDYDDQPLTMMPLSATRRAAQAGISPGNAIDNGRNAMTALINTQRSAATQRQEEQQSTGKSLRTESPEKRSLQEGLSPSKLALRPLSENKSATNTHIEWGAGSLGDVFVSGAEEKQKVAERRASIQSSSSAVGNLGVSTGHGNGVRTLRKRQQSAQESEESYQSAPQSFKTSITSKTSTMGHTSSQGHSFNLSPSAENVLGLLFPAQHVGTLTATPLQQSTIITKPESVIVTESSPQLSQTDASSSPRELQFSPLFSEATHGGGSSAPGGESWTPATATSALFGEGVESTGSTEGKVPFMTSSTMTRGATLPPSNVAAEVIREESLASLERSASVPPAESSALRDGKPRERSSTEQSAAYMTEESSEVSKHDMIVSTMSSPTQQKTSFDLTDVTGTTSAGGKRGPWSQSPLLLDTGLASDAEHAVGLGLSFGIDSGAAKTSGMTKRSSRHMELDMSQVDVIVQRADASFGGGALGLIMNDETTMADHDAKRLMPPHKGTQAGGVRASPSTTSTVEAFAINVTPPSATYEDAKPDHRVDVPSNVVGNEQRLSGDSRQRWSSRLWSMTSAFRSPTHGTFDVSIDGGNDSSSDVGATASAPPMRMLTLVGKQQHGETANSDVFARHTSNKQHRRSRSRDDGQHLKAAHDDSALNDDGYHSVPSSGVIPSQATFQSAIVVEPVAQPPRTLPVESRSSKHVHRPLSSRIRYVKGREPAEEQHIHVNMDVADGSAIIDVRSPRTADSPSGLTPRFGQLTGTVTTDKQQHRRSWTAANGAIVSTSASSAAGVASPWLAPKRQSHVGARDSELYSLAANVQALLRHAESTDEDAAAVEALLTSGGEEGLRRRANHRSANSMPNTPTFAVDTWTGEGEGAPEASDRGPSVMFHPNVVSYEADARQAPSADMQDGRQSRMGMRQLRRPLSGMPTLLRGGDSATYDDSPSTYLYLRSHRTSNVVVPVAQRARTVSGLFSGHYGDEIGLIAYSGKALQEVKTSQALFFAGFLLMPWLWFVGGWALDDDGLIHVEHEQGYGDTSNRNAKNRSSQRSTWFTDHDYNNSDDSDSSRSASNHWSAHVPVWPRTMLGGAIKRREAQAKALHRPENESIIVQMARHVVDDWRALDSYVVCNRVMALLASFVVMSGFGLAIAAVVVHY